MELPADDALRFLVATYARLRAAHGSAIGTPSLVQPTGEFFPDTFQHDAPSVDRLLRRVLTYAPVSEDLRVELAFVEGDHESAGGCGSLACGAGGASGSARRPAGVIAVEGGYRVQLAVGDVGNADVLTTALARSAGTLVLHEAGERLDDDVEVSGEIAAVMCGFGVLLANGAAVWAKSCGGLRMAQATALSVEEACVLLALFVAAHDIKVSKARAHLGATQREAFDLAVEWTESNPLLLESFRERPELLVGAAFDLEPVRGPLGRWLHKRKMDKERRIAVAAPAAPVSEERRRRLAEARALVDEVFGSD